MFGELLLGAGLLKECEGLTVCKEWLGDTFTKEEEAIFACKNNIPISWYFIQAGPILKWYCRARKKLDFQLLLCILHFTCPARQLLFACLNYWFSYQLTCLDLCGRKVTFPTRQSTRPGWPDRTFFLALVLIPSNLLILHSLRDYWSIKNDASWKISAFSQDLNFKTESFWILSLLQKLTHLKVSNFDMESDLWISKIVPNIKLYVQGGKFNKQEKQVQILL